MGIIRVACVQMCSGVDEARNLARMEDLVRQAAGQGAFYVQTPEMTGILQKDPARLMQSVSSDVDNPVFAGCARLSRELGIWLHLGSTAVKLENAKAANRGVLFSPKGERIAVYDKIHMFDVDVDAKNRWRESSRYEPGSAAIVVDTGGFRLGMSTCYDLRFPHLYRRLAQNGAAILTCPSAFTRPTGKAHWEVLLRARAIENGTFMIAAAQGGVHEDGRETWGHSMIVNPWGEIVAELDHDEPDVLVADIDLSEVEKAHKAIPSLENEREFSISVADMLDRKASNMSGRKQG